MAFTYANGRYPLSAFIHRGDNIYLTPSLNARWDEAVRLALAKYGVRLYITGDVDGLGGWNGYRPYPAQVRYKNHYGRFAAAPGWSSHGGRYGGREVFAIDVANWQQLGRDDVQAWGRFVAIMRLVGLTTDFVSPRELWHVGDFNDPWVVPTFTPPATPAGGASEPAAPTPKEIIMATEVIVTEKDNNGKALSDRDRRVAFVNTESGFSCDFSWLTLADADKWAKQVGMPAGALRFTNAGFDKFIGRLS
ncbi:hypothetical protein [Microbacterium sp. AR7-10]|uniref:hypothetical protein n=1 Tax=Microbacterium sp. AR7-10 TaxID=1891970 RepID=UPI0008FC430A|nr:hypothetical protein [Microbacterium sp. AR7-10]OIU88673.1 hypothetical protein BFN01_04310 [Microbacterium sp. AR7-10]